MLFLKLWEDWQVEILSAYFLIFKIKNIQI